MGIAVSLALILLTQSTFTIWSLLWIVIPGIGTIYPSDLFLLYIITQHYLFRNGIRSLDKLDLTSVLVGIWICIAFAMNYLFGEVPGELFVRIPLRLALLWLSFPAFRRLNLKSLNVLAVCVVAIVVSSTLIHMYVQFGDKRELMPLLYYAINPETSSNVEYQLLHYDYVRATPSGQLLCGAVFTSCLMLLFLDVRKKVKAIFAVIALTLGMGLIANITRSTLLGTFIICPSLVFANIKNMTSSKVLRVLCFCSCLPVVIVLLSGLMPELTERYTERFNSTSDYYGRNKFNPRVADNIAAAEELLERPLVGNGFPQLRNYISDTGGDVSSFLMISLQGGIPLLILFLVFTMKVWKCRNRHSDIYQSLSLVGFYYILIMWCLVTPGANGPHTLRELGPFLLFSSIICRKQKFLESPLEV